MATKEAWNRPSVIFMSTEALPSCGVRLEQENCNNRPLPKIFRMTKGNKLIDEIFKGATINTPSMMCVEDLLACYRYAAVLKRPHNQPPQ